MDKKEEKIPFHTRFGLRFLQVLLIVFSLVLVQRCVALYQDNKLTNEQVKTEYFQKGYDSGMKKAQGLQDSAGTPIQELCLETGLPGRLPPGLG